jgi:hypothetical protein
MKERKDGGGSSEMRIVSRDLKRDSMEFLLYGTYLSESKVSAEIPIFQLVSQKKGTDLGLQKITLFYYCKGLHPFLC